MYIDNQVANNGCGKENPGTMYRDLLYASDTHAAHTTII